jgi:hypothetical protein
MPPFAVEALYETMPQTNVLEIWQMFRRYDQDHERVD